MNFLLFLVVNDNLQIVNMWLAAEETTVLDNALITMEHLYRSGTVKICLRRLINESSYFQIGYSIRKNRENEEEEELQRSETLKVTLTISDIDDHKRQLTFCNVDLPANMSYKKVLLTEQLKLLKIVENIYEMLLKLEMSGHPEYQLREDLYDIHDRTGEIDSLLSDHRNDLHLREDRLKWAVKNRTDNLELIFRTLQIAYSVWMDKLEEYRREFALLNLFSNRQLMILIILLTKQNPIKCHFLEKISSSKEILTNKEKQLKLTIEYFKHYLSSLNLHQVDISERKISSLYEKHQIESNANAEMGLKKLTQFLRDFFPRNGKDFFGENGKMNTSEQYLVPITSTPPKALEHHLDLESCCILLNLFANQFPSISQILWCTNASEEDIHLFFSRIRIFPSLIFVLMNIDEMHPRLREILLNEQDTLTRQEQAHGTVFYFSKELTSHRRGLRPYLIQPQHRDPYHTYRQILSLFQKNNLVQPNIQIIYGEAGVGKSLYFISLIFRRIDSLS